MSGHIQSSVLTYLSILLNVKPVACEGGSHKTYTEGRIPQNILNEIR